MSVKNVKTRRIKHYALKLQKINFQKEIKFRKQNQFYFKLSTFFIFFNLYRTNICNYFEAFKNYNKTA